MTTDPELDFMESACRLLRASEICRKHDIPAHRITAHGKADNHHSLMVVRREEWRVPCTDAESEKLEGVEVHYESRRPGDWRIDCELAPRLRNPSSHSSKLVKDMLELKALFTNELRRIAAEEQWEKRFGAHTKRARPDPADPSSLMVLTFETGLPSDCTPDSFVNAVLPIIDATAPFINGALLDNQGLRRRV
ncbi:MAG: hypothetical protein JSR52_01555 [Planctomycetes bacterium]|nr:hypothetical protein [Planctomycetota bacterium]